MFKTLVVSWLLLSCAAGGAAAPPDQAAAPGPTAQEIMKALRQRLDLVARAKDRGDGFDVHDLSPTPVDVRPLIGVSRRALLNALGSASVDCRMTPVLDPAGRPGRIAPCQAEDDLAYSFYVLPKGWAGGGTALLLEFDGSETCSRARWVKVQ
jgi:hypothetical protein